MGPCTLAPTLNKEKAEERMDMEGGGLDHPTYSRGGGGCLPSLSKIERAVERQAHSWEGKMIRKREIRSPSTDRLRETPLRKGGPGASAGVVGTS